ncbi:glycosyltransferase family 4 protein [Candidatus Saganbacteria bacterium CG08_land_8_20_14_0_20_45_16]|uniref:Glycosyltransferase family 4 protein n=1 Tax=Candidatus Saganbacteria bacterium CG08_land_8_20_14_0_20_45_16 TaxID=2014293 RepID=A0A2H0XZA8_UNCSA|nr:MAG: glycosyltransferase family 4 protein [Candidatus Saganbacteria bacterium CG08_land_8_20_14_0_20_45_16]
MRIALIHDYLNQFGGAERVVALLHQIWPDAPIFTSIYDQEKMPSAFSRMDIRTSFMQRLPGVFRFFKYYLLLYPLAFERFDLADYDLIISSSSAFAKGIKKRQEQLHLCYCHTPMRFVWRFDDYLKREGIPEIFKSVLAFVLEPIKKWDLQTAAKVDYFIANSETVAKRIKEIYGRGSVIINPPVDCDLFLPIDRDHDYFLLVSRLNTYKRLDIVVKAFSQLDLPLKIIGTGSDRRNLVKLAGPSVEFLGQVNDQQLARYLAECRALIFPGEEDFGIVPLEAMSCGRPVIAYRAGGATETVIDGITGIFFDEQTPEALAEAVNRFNFLTFDRQVIRQQALKYDRSVFEQKIIDFVEKLGI